LELWFGGEARAWPLLGSAASSWPRHGRKLAGSATPEDAIDAGRASPRMIDLVIAVERRGARLNVATKRQMKSPSGAVAGLNRQAIRPARSAISFERTTAQPGLRWIDY